MVLRIHGMDQVGVQFPIGPPISMTAIKATNMSEQFICDEEKYIFKKRTIALPVSLENLPQKVKIDGYELLLKSSFHISLVCIGKIIEKHNVSIPDFENLIIKDFCEFIENHDVSLVGYRDEFRIATQNERKSVVMMADISNLNDFFDLINQKYNLDIEVHPTHVTLYTLQPDIGIFITDSDDLKQLTRKIKNPIKFVKFGAL